MPDLRIRWTENIRASFARIVSHLRSKTMDSDLDEELQSHIEMAVEEHLRRGLSLTEARRQALRSFGGMTQIRERYHEQRGVPVIEQLSRDIRFGLRQLWKSPGFALTAIGTLALGLGANVAIFSLMNGLLLRPLPVPRSEELAVIRVDRSDHGGFKYYESEPFFRAVAKHREAFDSFAAYSQSLMDVRTGTGTVKVRGAVVTGEFFSMLETPPLLGRTLTPQDDVIGSPGVYAVVISENFWRSWFQADPKVVGRTLRIANQSFTVVGVMPRSFIGINPAQRPQIYANLRAEPVISAPYSSVESGERSHWLNVMGRRRKGVSLESASAAIATVSDAVRDESIKDPESLKDAHENHFTLAAESGSKGFTFALRYFRKPLNLMMAMCGGVLLLACINLASLLLARSAARQRELATRLALGASRGRLVQQLMIESLMIALAGIGVALAMAPLVSHVLAALLLGKEVVAQIDVAPDIRVIGFASALTVAAVLLIGLLPAIRSTGTGIIERMKLGGQTKAGQGFGRERHRLLPRLLMSAEVALALLLVTAAGLLAASLTRLYRTGLGFEPKGLLNVDLDMDKQALEGKALVRWYQQYAEALKRLPGVSHVSFAGITPLSGSMEAMSISTPYSNGDKQVNGIEIGPDYFATMHIARLMGREFNWDETKTTPKGIIFNEAAARVLYPGKDALGQTVKIDNTSYEVIGIVANAHYMEIQEQPPPTAYRSFFPISGKSSPTAIVRSEGAMASVAERARTLASQMAPDAPPPTMTTMSSQLDESIASERMIAILSVFFAASALLVTAIGLYGTLAYATARRTSEIGVRMALGAQRTQVAVMVFRENAWVAVSGSIAGLGIALFAAKLIESFLYGTSARDPWILGGAVLALTAVASCASLLPAIRAARMQPMDALRTE